MNLQRNISPQPQFPHTVGAGGGVWRRTESRLIRIPIPESSVCETSCGPEDFPRMGEHPHPGVTLHTCAMRGGVCAPFPPLGSGEPGTTSEATFEDGSPRTGTGCSLQGHLTHPPRLCAAEKSTYPEDVGRRDRREPDTPRPRCPSLSGGVTAA